MSKETVRGWEKSKESEYNPLARWVWEETDEGKHQKWAQFTEEWFQGEGIWQAVARTERKVDVV